MKKNKLNRNLRNKFVVWQKTWLDVMWLYDIFIAGELKIQFTPKRNNKMNVSTLHDIEQQ